MSLLRLAFRRTTQARRFKVGQRGIALIVSLVMLVVITLIGVAVMGGSRLEWLMASNTRFQTDAAIRVESALRDGEQDTNINFSYNWGLAGDQFFDDSVTNTMPADPRNPGSWSGGGLSSAAANANTVAPTGTTNRYVAEYMGCSAAGTSPCGAPCNSLNVKCTYTYRIWAYSADNNGGGTARIAQSTFVRTVTFNALGLSSTTYARIAYAEIYDDQAPSP